MNRELIEILTSVLGTFAFAVILNAPKNRLLFVTLGGLISGTCLVIFQALLNNTFFSVCAASFITALYSEIFARLIKTPSTVIFIPSSIPLLPGGSLYYTVYNLIYFNKNNFTHYLKETAETGAGIALGVTAVAIIIFSIRSKRNAKTN